MVITAPGRGPRRSSASRWRVVAVATLVLIVLTGCGASFNAQTNQPYQPAEGTNSRDGDIYVLNALVVTDGRGDGTVVTTLINQRDADDALQSVTAVDENGNSIHVDRLAQEFSLAPQDGVQIPSDTLPDGGVISLRGNALQAGRVITVTFTFADAAAVEIGVPVVAVGTIYTGIPIGPSGSTSRTTLTPETPTAG